MASHGQRKGPLRAVLLDFGGVLAEDGFQEGLKAIASRRGLEPETFFRAAEDLIYETGYVLGRCAEADYWAALRERTGVTGSDGQLRAEILDRFTLRPAVLEETKRARDLGLKTAILSDQTNWLYEVEARTPFFRRFDFVFNSYEMHKGKRDPSVFGDVLSAMGLRPGEALFVDDKEGNVTRAVENGLDAVRFKDAADLRKQISRRLGGSAVTGGEVRAMEKRKRQESPRGTGVSEITGKVLRVKHATAADMVFIEKKLMEHHIDTGDMEPEQFVVAWEDGEMAGFGRLRRVGGADEISCILVFDEKKAKGVSDLILRHLVEYSGSTVVYAVTDSDEQYRRLGFKECPPGEAQKLDITCEVTGSQCLMLLRKEKA